MNYRSRAAAGIRLQQLPLNLRILHFATGDASELKRLNSNCQRL
jgi:hypothetical protein